MKLSTLYTSHTGYRGADRVDVTLYGADPIGGFLAPSHAIPQHVRDQAKQGGVGSPAFARFAVAYRKQMVDSWRDNQPAWQKLLGMETAVLCCDCREKESCHRVLIASFLAKMGVAYEGEK